MDDQRTVHEHVSIANIPTRPIPSVATQRPRLPGPRWIWWLGSVLALVALVSVLTQALLARGEDRLANQARAAATSAAAPQYFEEITAVAMTSPTNGWAFGTVGQSYGSAPPPTPTPGQCQVCTLILHYDGQHWTRVPTDPSLDIRVVSVSMLSSTEGWAVGLLGILHYTGGAWSVAERLESDEQHAVGLKGIAMVSATEGWAIGYQEDPNTGDSPLLLHYLHGAWSPAHLPIFDQPRTTIESVSMLPTGEGWIVGGEYADTGQRTIVLHLQHGTWTTEETEVGAQLNGVYALSRTEAWAVGTKDIALGPGVILHYLNGSWTSVPSPTPNLLHTVVMRSANEGWIGGDGAAVLHFDGQRWTKADLVIHGYQLTSLAVSGAGASAEGWGAGAYALSNGPPVMLHLSNGSWSQYAAPVYSGAQG